MRDKLFVIDVETTDQDAKKAHVCEYAIVGVNLSAEFQTVVRDFVKPPIPIPPETSAIHHITDEDVEGFPDWAHQSVVIRRWVDQQSDGSEAVFVAHNAEYEKVFIEPLMPTTPWICTYKCALRVWPDAPSHSNEGLRYFLKLGVRGRAFGQATHSAGHDATVTAQILQALISNITANGGGVSEAIDTLILWTVEPAQLPTCPIGKYRKQKWAAVPSDYLTWMAHRAPDMRQDARDCAILELKRRQGGGA